MTPEEIDALSLIKLQAEIAKAMGWRDVKIVTGLIAFDQPHLGMGTSVIGINPDPDLYGGFVPDYPHDIKAAMHLLDEMHRQFKDTTHGVRINFWDEYVRCEAGLNFYGDTEYMGTATIADNFEQALATVIARAYLKAKAGAFDAIER
jgi:hypothetical protein